MNKVKKKSLIFLILFISLFIFLFAISIVFTLFTDPDIVIPEGSKVLELISTDWFSGEISNNHEMNIPFSIFIQLLTTVGGVFFGVRIDQWFAEKEKEENAQSFLENIYAYLEKLKKGIENNENIYLLSEYRIYWDIIQKSDIVSTKQLLNNDKYADLSFSFCFLSYYKTDWKAYKNINEWESSSTTEMAKSICLWKEKVNALVNEYKN